MTELGYPEVGWTEAYGGRGWTGVCEGCMDCETMDAEHIENVAHEKFETGFGLENSRYMTSNITDPAIASY